MNFKINKLFFILPLLLIYVGMISATTATVSVLPATHAVINNTNGTHYALSATITNYGGVNYTGVNWTLIYINNYTNDTVNTQVFLRNDINESENQSLFQAPFDSSSFLDGNYTFRATAWLGNGTKQNSSDNLNVTIYNYDILISHISSNTSIPEGTTQGSGGQPGVFYESNKSSLTFNITWRNYTALSAIWYELDFSNVLMANSSKFLTVMNTSTNATTFILSQNFSSAMLIPGPSGPVTGVGQVNGAHNLTVCINTTKSSQIRCKQYYTFIKAANITIMEQSMFTFTGSTIRIFRINSTGNYTSSSLISKELYENGTEINLSKAEGDMDPSAGQYVWLFNKSNVLTAVWNFTLNTANLSNMSNTNMSNAAPDLSSSGFNMTANSFAWMDIVGMIPDTIYAYGIVNITGKYDIGMYCAGSTSNCTRVVKQCAQGVYNDSVRGNCYNKTSTGNSMIVYVDHFDGGGGANDTQVPTITTLTINDASLTYGGTTTVSCNATDNTGMSSAQITVDDGTTICTGTTSCSGSYTAATTGTKTVTCTAKDTATPQNSATKTGTISITTTSGVVGGGGGGGSSGSGTTTTTIPAAATSNIGTISTIGANAVMAANAVATFTVPVTTGTTQAHSAKVISIGTNKVTVTVSSTPQNVTINVNETKQVDLDGDKKADIELKLNKITTDNRADLTFKAIKAAEAVTPTTTTTTTGAAPTAKTSKSAIWITVIVILVILIVGYFLLSKKKK